jgi:hypothetical protein
MNNDGATTNKSEILKFVFKYGRGVTKTMMAQ